MTRAERSSPTNMALVHHPFPFKKCSYFLTNNAKITIINTTSYLLKKKKICHLKTPKAVSSLLEEEGGWAQAADRRLGKETPSAACNVARRAVCHHRGNKDSHLERHRT